jgi:hypothetical protein
MSWRDVVQRARVVGEGEVAWRSAVHRTSRMGCLERRQGSNMVGKEKGALSELESLRASSSRAPRHVQASCGHCPTRGDC